jgi:hypothetical protein
MIGLAISGLRINGLCLCGEVGAVTGPRYDPDDHPLYGLTRKETEMIRLAISGLRIKGLCSGGCGDWTTVRP